MGDLQYKTNEIVELSTNISNMKSELDKNNITATFTKTKTKTQKALICTHILLQCKEIKQPLQSIKHTLTNQIKFIEKDFDVLWDHLKAFTTHITKQNKAKHQKIQNLELTALELNDLCVKQNEMITNLNKKLRTNPKKKKIVKKRKKSQSLKRLASIHALAEDNEYIVALLNKVESDTVTKLKLKTEIKYTHTQISQFRNDFNVLKREWKIQVYDLENDYYDMMQCIVDNVHNIQQSSKTKINIINKQNKIDKNIKNKLEYYDLEFDKQQNKLHELENEIKQFGEMELKMKPLQLSNTVLSKQNDELLQELEEKETELIGMKKKYISCENVLKERAETWQHLIEELGHKNKELKSEMNKMERKHHTEIEQLKLQKPDHTSIKIATEVLNIINVKDIDTKIHTLKNLIDNLSETVSDENGDKLYTQFFHLCNAAMKKLVVAQSPHRQQSVTPNNIRQLQEKMEVLTDRMELIDTDNVTVDEYKQFMIKLKTFHRKINKIGVILQVSPCKINQSAKSSKCSQSESLPAMDVFNSLQSQFADLNLNLNKLKIGTIIEFIRDNGCVLSLNEWNRSIDDFGSTFLHKSVEIASTELAQELLSFDCDPNIQNIYGDSVLHEICSKFQIAANNKFMSLFSFILDSNAANLRIINNENKTCLEMITNVRMQRVVLVLLQNAASNANIQFGIKQIQELMAKQM